MFIRFTCIILLFVVNTISFATSTILILGDSLSAGYGLESGKDWPSLLEHRLANSDYTVINASISGDTTSGGKARLEELLTTHQPAVLILALGGNDGLRGTDLGAIEDNLSAIIELAQQQDAQILLVGVQLPPNYGPAYTQAFFEMYPRLAEKYNTALVPFLLDGFAESWDYFQSDGIHPTEQAQPQIEENVWQELKNLISGGN